MKIKKGVSEYKYKIEIDNKEIHMTFWISLLVFFIFIWIIHLMYYPENITNEKNENSNLVFKYPEHLKSRFNTMKLLLNSRNNKDELKDKLWEAIIMVESRKNPIAYNEDEKAAGIGQIRPIVISDLRRIGYTNWSNKDRWCPKNSKHIFNKYTSYWISKMNLKDTYENRARIWNGGPRGFKKKSTREYWFKVKQYL